MRGDINFHTVTRIEVIDATGKILVKHLIKDQEVKASVQDDGKTLKLFITNKQ